MNEKQCGMKVAFYAKYMHSFMAHDPPNGRNDLHVISHDWNWSTVDLIHVTWL